MQYNDGVMFEKNVITIVQKQSGDHSVVFYSEPNYTCLQNKDEWTLYLNSNPNKNICDKIFVNLEKQMYGMAKYQEVPKYKSFKELEKENEFINDKVNLIIRLIKFIKSNKY